MTASTKIFMASEFLRGHPIGMPGPGKGPLLFVIAAACIVIFKQDRDRRTGGDIIKHACFDQRYVVFLTGRGTQRPGFTPFDVGDKIAGR